MNTEQGIERTKKMLFISRTLWYLNQIAFIDSINYINFEMNTDFGVTSDVNNTNIGLNRLLHNVLSSSSLYERHTHTCSVRSNIFTRRSTVVTAVAEEEKQY